MPKVIVYNQQGSQVGELELSEAVYAVPFAQQAVFDTVIAEQAAKRQGTQKAKTRSEVRGGGKKPWRQKGTGRARQGSLRSPQFRGGGVVFAPIPRKYTLKVNKKVARLAMRSALSAKVAANQIFVVDEIKFDSYKTKQVVELIDNLKVTGRKVALVLEGTNEQVELAGRNIPYLLVQHYNHISLVEMLNVDSLIITKAAALKFEEVLK